MNNIPQEFQDIKAPTSVQDCMEIATSIFHFKDPIEKYKVFQAQNFFMNNISLFNKEEFSTVLKNKLFTRKYIQKPAYDILQKCVDEEIIYPFVLNSWFDKHVSYNLQYKYVALLDEDNNEEQLRIFNEQLPHVIMHHFDKADYPSTALIRIIVPKLPTKIFNIKSWDDSQVASWIKNNPEKSKEILHHNLQAFEKGTLPFPKSKIQLYQNIIEEHLNESKSTKEKKDKTQNNFHFSYTFSRYPLDYIEYLNSDYPELINNYLTKKFAHGEKGNSTINGLQSIIFNRDDSFHNLQKAFSQHKDLLKENIKVDIGFYTKETNFFEYCLAHEILQPFVFFNLNDDLKDDEKEILVAAAFMYFNTKDKHSNYKLREQKILEHWYPNIMEQCSEEQFSKYVKKLSLENNGLNKELEKIKLTRELNLNPTVTKSKKLKL